MWAPDSSRAACTRCGNEFVWHRRRHHCRCCGGLFCDSCSNYFVPVNNPINQPGVFGSAFADKNSGVHRVCFGCFHKYYAYVCVFSGFFGSSKTEVCSSQDEADRYMQDMKEGLIVHMGTAKITNNKNPSDPATSAKFLEKAKGKARKVMGESFYEEQAAANRAVEGPNLSHLLPYGVGVGGGGGFGTQRSQQQSSSSTTINNNSTNNNNNNNNNSGSNATKRNVSTNNNNNNDDEDYNNSSHYYQNPNTSQGRVAVVSKPASTVTATATVVVNNNNTINNDPLPHFTYVVCMCLASGARRLRFLQSDVHTDKAKLILDVQKLATEEFDASGTFVDQTSFVEAVVLLDANWKTPLFVQTARFYYRSQPYIDTTIEQIMRHERFVICAHRGGRAQCELVVGGADARQRLFDCATAYISAVVVAGGGEPVGHTCRDVSWRRDLVDRADSDGLRLLYDGQTRVVFVASTIRSANSDVRVSQSLWDIEQTTCGQIRTTVQAWVWDTQNVEKKCIVSPFLGGALAPPCVGPGQMDQVSSSIRRAVIGTKQAAPVPTANSNNNNNNNIGATAAAAASGATVSTPSGGGTTTFSPLSLLQTKPLLSSSSSSTSSAILSTAPPRPSSNNNNAGATAAASQQAQVSASTRPAPISQIPECPVCMDEFNAGVHKPLILNCCGHSLCAQCYSSLIERRPANTTTVSCPRCREEIPITQKLVPNRTLLEQLS